MSQQDHVYMSATSLWEIAWEYEKTIEPGCFTGYGNGFDRYGKSYFSCLCKNFPHFKAWAILKYPDTRYYAR